MYYIITYSAVKAVNREFAYIVFERTGGRLDQRTDGRADGQMVRWVDRRSGGRAVG